MTTSPLVAHTRDELQAALRARPGKVGFVPTMGALHEGHACLIDRARTEVGQDAAVVVSIFVNPLQFGPGEDFDRYPRTFDADLHICAEHGADIVFAPPVEVVYPDGEPTVRIDPGELATRFEGESRPGHFAGVLTVVAKLFGLVRPDVAVFGEKDYQQLVLIQQMARDLCMDIAVVGGETQRAADGLALSSRNRYLTDEQREVALTISRALAAARERAEYGEPAARWAAMRVLKGEPGLDLDYLALTSPDLGEAPESGAGRVLVAAKVGNTRLLDNCAITFGGYLESLAASEGER